MSDVRTQTAWRGSATRAGEDAAARSVPAVVSSARGRGEGAQKNHAISEFTGQNDKVHDTNPVLQAPCGAKAKEKGKSHKGGRGH